MASTSGIGFGVQVLAGVAFAVILGAGAYFLSEMRSDGGAPALVETSTVQPDQPAVPSAIEAAPKAPAATTVRQPKFDVVRVEPDGASVIAGDAPAGSKVAILLGGVQIGQATADAQGKFVGLLSLPPSTDAQVLSLSLQDFGGVEVISDENVIIAPTTPTLKVTQPADETTPETTTAETATAETAAAENNPPPVAQPTAPAVLLTSEQGVRVLQSASPNPADINNVAIDAISYNANGDVQLSGRGFKDGFVRAYLNDAPIQTTRIENGGGWHMSLPDVDSGVYTLRVDQVDATGNVTSRTQTPFKREAAEVLEGAQTANLAKRVTAVTVQPGSTLWEIARQTYGDGTLYVRVFEANSATIANPDLIYPGQVFSVPE